MSQVDIVRDLPMPDLGPLIALAFDKTVTIVVKRWKLLLLVLLLSTASGFYGVNFAYLPPIAFATYWAFACYANAVRLERPGYQMTPARVMTLIGLFIGTALLIDVGISVVRRARRLHRHEVLDGGDRRGRPMTSG